MLIQNRREIMLALGGSPERAAIDLKLRQLKEDVPDVGKQFDKALAYADTRRMLAWTSALVGAIDKWEQLPEAYRTPERKEGLRHALHKQDELGRTALHYARDGQIGSLMQAGAPVWMQAYDLMNPVQWAVSYRDESRLKEFAKCCLARGYKLLGFEKLSGLPRNMIFVIEPKFAEPSHPRGPENAPPRWTVEDRRRGHRAEWASGTPDTRAPVGQDRQRHGR
jgi:hypothetical protein